MALRRFIHEIEVTVLEGEEALAEARREASDPARLKAEIKEYLGGAHDAFGLVGEEFRHSHQEALLGHYSS